MTTQYDAIAEQYKALKNLTFFEVIEYNLFNQLEKQTGKSVLDLACGEGFYTRKLKRLECERLVGVDISQEMIALAKKQDAEEPLGIEYIHSAVQELGKIGNFDLITAVFLLNYAKDKADLLQMCQTIYDNLKEGERFFAINDNAGKATAHPTDYQKYGFSYHVVSEPLTDGGIMRITLASDKVKTQFDVNYFSEDAYNWAFKTAGFKNVIWHKLTLPPTVEQREGKAFWDFFIEQSPFVLFECQK